MSVPVLQFIDFIFIVLADFTAFLEVFAYDGFGIEHISANVANMRFVYSLLYFDMPSYDDFGIEEISTHVATMKAAT